LPYSTSQSRTFRLSFDKLRIPAAWCLPIFCVRLSAQGGLEGCKPSKNHLFLVVFAGKAGKYHQKYGDLGEAVPPQSPPPRKSRQLKSKVPPTGTHMYQPVFGRKIVSDCVLTDRGRLGERRWLLG
jgi:hypothetical protein